MKNLKFTDPDELERFQKWEADVNENLPKCSERQALAWRERAEALDTMRQSV